MQRKAEREAELEAASTTQDPTGRCEKLQRDLQLIREAQDYVAQYEYGPPRMLEGDVSPKVWLLWKQLQNVYKENPETKCIIFVERRLAARTIYECLKDQVSRNFRPAVLLGSRSSDYDGGFTIRQQILNVHHFKIGALNCLFTTSVAEEGLDVPDCNLVIRFDIYNTMIQYVQSRGRARDQESTYFHMIEKGNLEHLNLIKGVLAFEQSMKSFCRSLPADRLLGDTEPLPQENSANKLYYCEKRTGAKLTHSVAMQFIATYAAHLVWHLLSLLALKMANVNQENGYGEQPTYVLRPAGREQFTCTLILPEGSPVRVYECTPQRTKALAKSTAAFEMVMLLRKKEAINEHFLPPRRKLLPKYANARLALDIKKTNTYAVRRKPAFWDVEDGTVPTKLWITIITFEEPGEIFLGEKAQPICIATRNKLPEIPCFDVYGTRGGISKVKFSRLEEPLEITEAQVELLITFTGRVFMDVFNKRFEMTYDTLRYWFAPVIGCGFDEKTKAALLDWDLIGLVAAEREIFIDSTAQNFDQFRDSYWVDRIDRSRRFFAYEFIPSLNCQDPVPSSIGGHTQFDSIQDYSYNAGKGRKWTRIKWDIPKKEPVFRAERFLHRLNFLDPPAVKEKEGNYDAFITPSNFTISILPASLVRSTGVFPAISTRLDSYLHAWELLNRLDSCENLGLNQLDLRLALEAITKDSRDTSITAVEMQRTGMGNNYERLEFLGDCYLKLATSISLYCVSHTIDEFQLHVHRMTLICNQYLFKRAVLVGIPEFIQTIGFSRRTWYPNMKLIHGKKSGPEAMNSSTVKLGDKSVADVCEALIGAALVGLGHDGATKMVTTLLGSKYHKQRSFNDYYQQYTIPEYQLSTPTAVQMKLADDIAEQFGYHFHSPKLLMSAFTHASNPFIFEKVPSYQRLEFLGKW